jgi:hypothetical protein
MYYLKGYLASELYPPKYQSIAKTRKIGRKPAESYSQFTGALYIPTYRLLICSYGDNDCLYTNYHALVKLGDGTPAIPCMVITHADAMLLLLESHYCSKGSRPRHVTRSSFEKLTIENVTLPKDNTPR